MNANRVCRTLGVLVWLAVAQSGLAFYNPSTGRWLNRDPIGEREGLNLQRFVANNAVNYVDILGLRSGDGKYRECTYCMLSEWKRVFVAAVVAWGANYEGPADIQKTRDIYEQCCIRVDLVALIVLGPRPTEAKIGADLILDEYSSPGNPTREELALTASQSSGVVNIYYVRGLSQGSYGESFWSSAFTTPPAHAAVVGIVVPHEMGHVLLNSGGHVRDPNNLMADGGINNGTGLLTESQCDRIRTHRLVR